MATALDSLAGDPEALKAAFLALEAKAAALAARNERLEARAAGLETRTAGLEIDNARLAAENVFLDALNRKLELYLAKLKRLTFGPSSEKLKPDQLQLALEDIEQKIAEVEAEHEKTASEPVKEKRAERRRSSRPALPPNLPEVHVTIEPEGSGCPCCRGTLHRIGEDVSTRLDVIPVQYRKLITHRPKYACRSCEGRIVQAPAPERLIRGGLPTEAMVASVVVAKYADHQPLYRQSQGLARQGVMIGRDVLAFWVGYYAAETKPIWRHIREELLASSVIFVDETEAPTLDPGRGRTKAGYMWTIARDPRPWGGTDPPAVAFTYAPGRGNAHAIELLKPFEGIVHCDGYGAYKAAARGRNGQIMLAHCWAHLRRDFLDLTRQGPAPIASEALVRIARLYAIEGEIRGQCPEQRQAVRAARSRPLVADLFAWLEERLKEVPGRLKTAEVIRYALGHRDGLSRFLEDGRIELDNNTVERAIRPIALNRKNALFAGGDEGGETWAILATLIECCKMNGVEPQSYLTDVVTRLVNGHPQSRIGELTPWSWKALSAPT